MFLQELHSYMASKLINFTTGASIQGLDANLKTPSTYKNLRLGDTLMRANKKPKGITLTVHLSHFYTLCSSKNKKSDDDANQPVLILARSSHLDCLP